MPQRRGNDRMREGLNSFSTQPFAVYTSFETMEKLLSEMVQFKCMQLTQRCCFIFLTLVKCTRDSRWWRAVCICVCLCNASTENLWNEWKKRAGRRRTVRGKTEMYRFPMPSLKVQIVAIALCAYECDRFHVWRCGIGKGKTKNIRNLVKFKFHTCSHQVIPSVCPSVPDARTVFCASLLLFRLRFKPPSLPLSSFRSYSSPWAASIRSEIYFPFVFIPFTVRCSDTDIDEDKNENGKDCKKSKHLTKKNRNALESQSLCCLSGQLFGGAFTGSWCWIADNINEIRSTIKISVM